MCANVSNAKLKHRVHYIEAVRLLSLHRTAPAILRFLHLVLHICVYTCKPNGAKRAAGTKLFIIETLLSRDAFNQCAQKAPSPAKLTDSKTGVAPTGRSPEAFCE